MKMDFELAGTVILSGLLIVFLVLVLLTALVWAFGKLMVNINTNKEKGSKSAEAAPLKTVPAPAAAPAAQVIEDGISDELVAVITASIAAMLGAGENFAIKSVKRAAASKGSRSVWSMAGMQQNTSPF